MSFPSISHITRSDLLRESLFFVILLALKVGCQEFLFYLAKLFSAVLAVDGMGGRGIALH